MIKLKDKSCLTKKVISKNKGGYPALVFPLVFLTTISFFAGLLSLKKIFYFSSGEGQNYVFRLSYSSTSFGMLFFGLFAILGSILFYFSYLEKKRSQNINFSLKKEVKDITTKVYNVCDGGSKLIKSDIVSAVDDPKKRQLLKFAGIAFLGFIVPTLFKMNKTEAAYFGSVPGSGVLALKDSTGAKIDPAIKSPTDGYKISEMEDATTSYFGYVNKDGAWYIMKDDGSGAFRYVKGSSDFAAQWALRSTTLSYDTFDNVF
jgi:hypothetical protein